MGRAPAYPPLPGQEWRGGEGGENRPLQLSEARYKLEELYLNHGIASEISRKRLNQDRNIRADYY